MTRVLESGSVPQTQEAPAVPGPRLNYIDWLRVGAIAGVFLFHTLRPFNTEDWHVKNAETSELLTVAMVLFWTFGLAVLFLLAGAGVRFALRKRSWRTFIGERTMRLLVPFVIGTLLLSPVQAFIEANNKGTYSGSLTDFLGSWGTGVVNQVGQGVSPTIFGIGYHLWFLGFLFAISIVSLPLCAALSSRRGQELTGALAARASWPGASLAFALPIAVMVMVFYPFGTDEHDWFEFGWYLSYFLIGYVLFFDERFLAAVRRDLPIALVVGLACSGAMLVLMDLAESLPERGFDWAYPVVLGVFSLDGWAWTIVVLNVGLRVARLQRPLSQRIGDAVLPVYVLHQPVILAVAFFVVLMPLGIVPKAIIVLALSGAITLTLVELGLRSSMTRVLLGARVRATVPAAPSAGLPSGSPRPAAQPSPRTHHAKPR